MERAYYYTPYSKGTTSIGSRNTNSAEATLQNHHIYMLADTSQCHEWEEMLLILVKILCYINKQDNVGSLHLIFCMMLETAELEPTVRKNMLA